MQVSELARFIDVSLRGKKAALHALESSISARYLSHHLASWGMDISHVALRSDDDQDTTSSATTTASAWASPARMPQSQAQLGRYDSGFGGSDQSNSPHYGAASPAPLVHGDPFASFSLATNNTGTSRSSGPSEPSLNTTSPPLDPTLNFIIIDDDISTLKRHLILLRNNPPTVQLHNALLAKRPQLQSRRTRSSQAVHRVAAVQASIIYFTSLTSYRQIKDIVHSVFKNASSMFPLPEVLVVPKPIGPRRLLTTLFSAVKRPTLDPFFVPIATSPASPGGQYSFGGGRPSPAPSHVNDFDIAAGQALHANRQGEALSAVPSSVTNASTPKTPPVPLNQQTSNPPSPVSPDALEYFSKSTVELGSSASQGVIIQSPDGRATGLFFQPRAASLHDKAESMRLSRTSGASSHSDHSTATAQSARPRPSPSANYTASIASNTELPAIVIPDNMDFNSANRAFTVSNHTTKEDPRSFGQRGETMSAMKSSPSMRSAEFASPTSVKSEDNVSNETYTREFDRVRSEPSSPPTAHETSSQKRSQDAETSTSPIARDFTSKETATLPANASLDKPNLLRASSKDSPLESRPASPTRDVEISVSRARRLTNRAEKLKKTSRRPTGTLVPPINVLIVEGALLLLINYRAH